MSRDVVGSYTLPGSVNPVVPGTTITDAWGNQTMNDVAAALTDSLSRSGKGGMTAQLKLADGTASVPSISFSNETTTGFYRAAAGIIRLGVATTPLLEFTAANVTALLPLMAPTPATNINTTQVPTTAWVNTFYAALAGPTFTGVVTIPAGADITGYAKLAGPTFTGVVTIPAGAVISGYAPLAGPTFTGMVILPPTGAGATEAVRKDYADSLSFAAALPLQTGSAGKFVTTNGTTASWIEVPIVVQPLSRRAFITASTTHTIPAGVKSARVYSTGAGAAATTIASGGGGGMAYGDFPVVAGDVLTITIAAGSATVLKGGVTMTVGNPASGITAGTAGIGTAVANGGAFSGGAGVASSGGNHGGGASSGSPLGVGTAGIQGLNATGGSGWGGGGGVNNGGGGGVGGSGAASGPGGPGLSFPSLDPLLVGLDAAGGGGPLNPGGLGGGGGPSGNGGFGGGGGVNANGGFGGGGGGGSPATGGAGGFGGGGGAGTTAGGAGGAPAVLIFY